MDSRSCYGIVRWRLTRGVGWSLALLCAAAAAQRPGQEVQGTGEPFTGALIVDARGSDFRDPIRLERLIERIDRTPFSDIILQVRHYGDAHYNSRIAPKALGISETFDPLAAVLAGLRSPDRGGMPAALGGRPGPRRVLAWIDPFTVANVNRAVPAPDEHVTIAHPDWLSLTSDFENQGPGGQQYLEPGLEAVREHLARIVVELVTRYPIDGIVIGPLRYPGLEGNWGYHPTLLRAWRESTGERDQPAPDDPRWRAIRRDYVTRSLISMAGAARRARPGVLVGAFVLAEGPAPASLEEFAATPVALGALADWPLWMREGAVDFLILENFRSEGLGAADFDGWNAFAADQVQATGVEVFVGIAGFRNISLDVLGQIRRVHRAGLAGIALSNYREPIQDSTSRELFFRVLAGNDLGPDAERLPFPEPRETAIVVAPPFPPVSAETSAEEAPPSEGGEPMEEQTASASTEPGDTEVPPSQPAVVEQPQSDLDRMLAEVSRRVRERTRLSIEPSEKAVIYLKRRYPNIF